MISFYWGNGQRRSANYGVSASEGELRLTVRAERQHVFDAYLESIQRLVEQYACKGGFSYREDLSIYREILRKEFEENTCFYCGKKLTGVVHVDHFIPWSYVKDDKMWNFVLSCSSCNLKKNNRIPVERFLIKIQNRNSRAKQIQNRIVYEDFKEYNNDRLQRLWKYAQLSGLKEFSL